MEDDNQTIYQLSCFVGHPVAKIIKFELPDIWSKSSRICSFDWIIKVYNLLDVRSLFQNILKLRQQFMGCYHCLNLNISIVVA